MHIVVAPQEFKGSLTAVEAARSLAEGARRAVADATIDEAPVSDGGPGLLDALLAGIGGVRRMVRAHDPLMRNVDAPWALLSDGAAAIEMVKVMRLLKGQAGKSAHSKRASGKVRRQAGKTR